MKAKRISPERAKKLVEDARDEGVRIVWRMPGDCAGRMVTREYAGLGQYGVLERTTDLSDESVVYRLRDWIAEDEEHPGLNYRPLDF